MDIWKVAQVAFIIIMVIALWQLEKKDLDRARSVLANAFVWTLGVATPLAFIEMLSAFGVSMCDVPWAFTPLDFMSATAMMALLVIRQEPARIESPRSNAPGALSLTF